jgi:hypothetical protein
VVVVVVVGGTNTLLLSLSVSKEIVLVLSLPRVY